MSASDAGHFETAGAQSAIPEGADPRRGVSKILLAGLTLVAAIAVFAGALFYTGGLDALMNGELDLASLVPGLGGGSGEDSSVPPTGRSSVATGSADSSAVAAPEIPTKARERIFYEQIASQESINGLLDNEFRRFDYGAVSGKGKLRKVRVTARYRSGGSFSGTMTLRRYDGVWLFDTIVRDENAPNRVPTTPEYDPEVVDALVKTQVKNQAGVLEIIDGEHTRFTVDRIVRGSGTATIVGKQAGDKVRTEIVAISKEIEGETYWFLAGITQQ